MNVTLNRYYTYFVYLFFIPLWITGPAICDILVTFGAVLSLFNFNKVKKIDKSVFKFFKYYILAIIIFFLITTLNNYNFDHHKSLDFIAKSLFDIRFPLFCLFLISDDNLSLKLKFQLLFLSILFVLIFIYLEVYTQIFFQYSLFGFDSPHILDRNYFDTERISGPFVDELILGSFLSKIILPSYALFLLLKNNFKIFSYLFLLLTSFIIFSSAEKNAIVNLFLIYLFIFLFYFKKISFSKKLFSALSTFIILILLTNIFLPKQFNRFFYETISSFGLIEMAISIKEHNSIINPAYNEFDLDNSFDRNFINTQHGALLEKSIYMIKHKYLFGYGRNGFVKICDSLDETNFSSIYSSYCSTHTHNYIVETSVNYGLFGLFIFLFCFYNYIKSFKYNYLKLSSSEKKISISFFITIMVILFPINLTSNFYNNYSSVLFWFILAMSLMYKNSEN